MLQSIMTGLELLFSEMWAHVQLMILRVVVVFQAVNRKVYRTTAIARWLLAGLPLSLALLEAFSETEARVKAIVKLRFKTQCHQPGGM